MNKLQKPSQAQLDSINLSTIFNRIPVAFRVDKGFFMDPPGIEHYKLLAYIGTQYKDTVLTEVGTLWGGGALAMGYNTKNEVHTFDIAAHSMAPMPRNIRRKIIPEGAFPVNEIIASPFIFYDAAHNGPEERVFVQMLTDFGWKGTVMFDDIRLSGAMFTFWQDIQQPKEEWTDVGHYCGTGIVYFE